MARRLLGDLAYKSRALRGKLAEGAILLATERAERRPGIRQSIETALVSLKQVFGLGETLARAFVGQPTRIAAAKMTAYTYAFYFSRLLGRPQGRIIKELRAINLATLM